MDSSILDCSSDMEFYTVAVDPMTGHVVFGVSRPSCDQADSIHDPRASVDQRSLRSGCLHLIHEPKALTRCASLRTGLFRLDAYNPRIAAYRRQQLLGHPRFVLLPMSSNHESIGCPSPCIYDGAAATPLTRGSFLHAHFARRHQSRSTRLCKLCGPCRWNALEPRMFMVGTWVRQRVIGHT